MVSCLSDGFSRSCGEGTVRGVASPLSASCVAAHLDALVVDLEEGHDHHAFAVGFLSLHSHGERSRGFPPAILHLASAHTCMARSRSKSSRFSSGMIPGEASSPIIENVFPEPAWRQNRNVIPCHMC